jgi:MscS family membrane protein
MCIRDRSPLDDQIVPLVRKAIRIFLIVLFVLFTAENVFGADITAWLAGLGIAGLAVSLAAQDSIKNLFGSFTILLDRPFSVGERVTIEQADGTVEEIGFRSTKIRTLDGMVVTIPNSKVVDSAVKNVARRPHIRRVMNITITYDTPADKIEQAVQIIRDILAHPDIAGNLDAGKFAPRVSFDEFNADSLNIKVFYWFVPPDYWQYLEHAQRFNLMLFRAFEQADIDFAFPTQTIHLANDDKRQLRIEGLGD